VNVRGGEKDKISLSEASSRADMREFFDSLVRAYQSRLNNTPAKRDEDLDDSAELDEVPQYPVTPKVLSKPTPKSSISGPKCVDEHQMEQRQKQIDYGHETLGYIRYRLFTASNVKRTTFPEVPRTPNKYQACSKRTWDGQIKKWRRDLHKWDPEDPTAFLSWLESDFVLQMIEKSYGPELVGLIHKVKERAAKFQNSPTHSEPEDGLSDSCNEPVVAKKLVF